MKHLEQVWEDRSQVNTYNNSMENNPSDTDSCPYSQEIPHLLWSWRFCYFIHKNSPLNLVMSQINLVHIITLHFFKDLFEHYPPKWSLPSWFQIHIPTVFLLHSHVCYVLYAPLPLRFHHHNQIPWFMIKLIIIILFDGTTTQCRPLPP